MISIDWEKFERDFVNLKSMQRFPIHLASDMLEAGVLFLQKEVRKNLAKEPTMTVKELRSGKIKNPYAKKHSGPIKGRVSDPWYGIYRRNARDGDLWDSVQVSWTTYVTWKQNPSGRVFFGDGNYAVNKKGLPAVIAGTKRMKPRRVMQMTLRQKGIKQETRRVMASALVKSLATKGL